jgi:prophage antirepressor-like protein
MKKMNLINNFGFDVSNNNIINSEYSNNSITTIYYDDNLWIKGKEVATFLGYKNTRDAIIRHVDNEDKINFKDIEGGSESRLPNYEPKTIFINETGFYDLIFKSKLKLAKAFKRWVYKEVIPNAIKKKNKAIIPANNDLIRKKLEIEISSLEIENINKISNGMDRLGLDDRDKLMIKGAYQNILSKKRVNDINTNNNQLSIEYKKNEECSISLRIQTKYSNIKIPSKIRRKIEIETGKLSAKSYRLNNGKEPPKRKQYVDGTIRMINHYVIEDFTDFIDDIIKSQLKRYKLIR